MHFSERIPFVKRRMAVYLGNACYHLFEKLFWSPV